MKDYYFAYKYLGCKEKDIPAKESWIITSLNSLTYEALKNIMKEICDIIADETNQESDEITNADIIITFIQELQNG